MDVVALLRSKNRCLERFHAMSLEFLGKAEGGDLSELSRLEAYRDSCLKATQLYDRKIAECARDLPAKDPPESLRQAVLEQLTRREAIVQRILATDEKILMIIREAQESLGQSLQQTRKSRQTVGKFKSSWVHDSGEGIDKKL